MDDSVADPIYQVLEKRGFFLKGGLRIMFGMLGLAAILCWSAGRWDWRAAWLLAGLSFVVFCFNMGFLLHANPEVVVERMTADRNAENWDKKIAGLLALLWLWVLILAGLDERFGWSPEIPLWLRWSAIALFVVGDGVFVWAMSTNRFFSKLVRIQKERGHVAVTSGPYRYVRHPGYVGWVMMAVALPVILESWWALLPACLSVLLMVFRTHLEDRLLQNGLDGYPEYAANVRYRLFPGVY